MRRSPRRLAEGARERVGPQWRGPAEDHGRPGKIGLRAIERDRIYNQIMERGWNSKTKAFTQHYDSYVLDSSLLLMPLQGFVSPSDPMWLSTLDAMDSTLVSDSLVNRYNPGASPDGLRGDERTLSLCTFWYADALARAGRLDEAALTSRRCTHLRQPRRAVLRGDRPDRGAAWQHRGAAWQLPAGVHSPTHR